MKEILNLFARVVGGSTKGAASGTTYEKPNILVLGVGHSGTTVVTKMLFALGWQANDADEEFAECQGCRDVSARYLERRDVGFDRDRAKKELAALREPWALKDPRHVLTLHLWLPLFSKLPFLIWLKREVASVKQSYARRGLVLPSGEPGYYERTIEQLYELAGRQYESWPGPKIIFQYEQIAAASRLFDCNRV